MKSKDPYAAFRFHEFNIFLLTRFAFTFAWTMQFVVIEWEVYTLTKDPLSLGIIGLVEVIPAVGMALFAGHVVDQREKKGLLVKCILGFTIISLGLFLLTWPLVVGGWPEEYVIYGIYTLVFLGGFVRAFIGPTLFALLAQVVPKKNYPNAITWNSTVQQTGRVIGPAFGGLAIHWFGVHWSLCIVFVFAFIALVSLSRIKPKPVLNPRIGEPIFQSLRNGLHFVYKTKEIMGAITLDMIAVLFGGAVALLPIFAQDILKVGSEGFGILRAAPAVGSFITMAASAYFPLNRKAGLKLLASVFGFGVAIVIFGLSSWFWISVLALFLSGATDGISMIIRQTILQLKTPDEMRGRVSSVNSIFVGSSNQLGAFESGFTAKLMGTVTAVVFGGGMTLLTVVTTGLAVPKLRRLDLQKDVEDAEK